MLELECTFYFSVRKLIIRYILANVKVVKLNMLEPARVFSSNSYRCFPRLWCIFSYKQSKWSRYFPIQYTQWESVLEKPSMLGFTSFSRKLPSLSNSSFCTLLFSVNLSSFKLKDSFNEEC